MSAGHKSATSGAGKYQVKFAGGFAAVECAVTSLSGLKSDGGKMVSELDCAIVIFTFRQCVQSMVAAMISPTADPSWQQQQQQSSGTEAENDVNFFKPREVVSNILGVQRNVLSGR